MPQPLPQRLFTVKPISLAIAAAVSASAVHAQTAAPAADGLQLDRIVITGTTGTTSKMKASNSLSTLDGDSIAAVTATSATELLRSVPGLRSESSGGESNANVGVRGIPISAGGARYIQFQEDGLPLLQFGDIALPRQTPGSALTAAWTAWKCCAVARPARWPPARPAASSTTSARPAVKREAASA